MGTTMAILIKSKKSQNKITPMTTTNLVTNPPGSPVKKSRTNSSPPNALNAAVTLQHQVKL